MTAGVSVAESTRLVIGNRNYSSWSLRAWFFLRFHAIEFETVRLALDTPSFAAQVARYSPTGRVPVLEHDGRVVWDSLAICEYAAENLTKSPGWPGDPGARALARSVACEMHAGFADLRRELPLNCRARNRCVSPGPRAAGDIARVISIWNDSRQRYGEQGPWLFGEFSIADAMYAPVALRFMTYGFEPGGDAGAWVANIASHPAIIEWTDAAQTELEIIEAEEVGLG